MGVVAALGFAIGVVWPRLVGWSLVPEPPTTERSVTLEEEDAPTEPSAPEPEVIELQPEDRLAIGPPKITSCVDSEGKKTSSCDSPAVDDMLHPHLLSLLGCPAAAGVFGNLSLGVRIDFEKKKVHGVTSGRSTDLPSSVTEELLRCAEKEFAAASRFNSPHNYSSYQVYYSLTFKTPEAAAEEKTAVTLASGQATVQWRTALIRKEAHQEAEVQARLLSGARVLVTGRMGDWFRVKYDARGREGWVHGNAIGLAED